MIKHREDVTKRCYIKAGFPAASTITVRTRLKVKEVN